MKRLFKYIVRKVDEKVSNSIKNVTECINTISDKMKNKEDLINFGMIFITAGLGLGVGLVSLGSCMVIKGKSM